MKMSRFTFKNQIASFEDYMDFYLKNKPTDCILYSEDGGKFGQLWIARYMVATKQIAALLLHMTNRSLYLI